jgi:hypothetical protein
MVSLEQLLNKYWNEWDSFNSRSGPFQSDKPCWSSGNIDNNATAKWHKTNSWYKTEYLGKFACRVTSKIVGIGNAERCWGDLKTLKTGKRSHLSSAATSKAATVYGTACADKAEKESQYRNRDEGFTMWDDKDIEALGLGTFGITTEEIVPSTKKQQFNYFIEGWEDDQYNSKDPMSCVRLCKKNGGMCYLEGDKKLTIHKTKMNFIPTKGERKKEWHALGCTDD